VAHGQDAAAARNLDPRLFTAIDTRQVTQDSAAERQRRVSGGVAAGSVVRREERNNNKYSGVPSLTITSPVDFWRTSKF